MKYEIIDEKWDNVKIDNSTIIIGGLKDKEIVISGGVKGCSLRAKIVNEDGNEIDSYMPIRITKYRAGNRLDGEVEQVARIAYADINTTKICTFYKDYQMKEELHLFTHKTENEWYRFKKTITLKDENDQLSIEVVNMETKNIISKERTKLALDVILL